MTNPRITRTEAHKKLIDAGISLLLDDKGTAGFDSLNLAEAIRLSGVPRPSAYRALQDPKLSPTDTFRSAVMQEVYVRSSVGRKAPIEQAVAPLIAATLELANEATSSEMTIRLKETIRVLGNSIYDIHVADPYTRLVIASQIVNSDSTSDQLFQALTKTAAQGSRAQFAESISAVASLFGCMLAPGWSWSLFTSVAGDPLAGFITNRANSPVGDSLEFPTGQDGSVQRWTSYTVNLWVIVCAAWRPSPRFTNPADPQTLNTLG